MMSRGSGMPAGLSTIRAAGARRPRRRPRRPRSAPSRATTIRRMSVAGKTAIVTGAATGIGAATARLLAERGARVVAAGLQPDALNATVEAIVAAGEEPAPAGGAAPAPPPTPPAAPRGGGGFGGPDGLGKKPGTFPPGPRPEGAAAPGGSGY